MSDMGRPKPNRQVAKNAKNASSVLVQLRRLHQRIFKRTAFLLVVWGVLTACYSSDTLFIQLTATPLPTAIPPTPSINSLYRQGETVQIVGQGIGAVYLTDNPEPPTRRNRVPNAVCYPNTRVVISDVQAVDGVTYYQVACAGIPGWLTEESLSAVEAS